MWIFVYKKDNTNQCIIYRKCDKFIRKLLIYICENVRFLTTFPERKKIHFFWKICKNCFMNENYFMHVFIIRVFISNNMLYTATSYDRILIKTYACSRNILHVKSQIYTLKIQDKSHTGQFYACSRIK